MQRSSSCSGGGAGHSAQIVRHLKYRIGVVATMFYATSLCRWIVYYCPCEQVFSLELPLRLQPLSGRLTYSVPLLAVFSPQLYYGICVLSNCASNCVALN